MLVSGVRAIRESPLRSAGVQLTDEGLGGDGAVALLDAVEEQVEGRRPPLDAL
ncbi:MAG: hypothetical protein OXC99_04335 [Chloroflexi bacterium]|nr:hypothetical protein [Chloroflexota bacterium]